MKKIFTLAIAWMVMVAGSMHDAHAVLRIDINDGTFTPMPIAIPSITGGTAEMQDIGRKVSEVVAADLERSGLFRIVDKRAFLQNVGADFVLPAFM